MDQGEVTAAPRATGFSWLLATFVSSFAVMAMALATTVGFSAAILAGALLYGTIAGVSFAPARTGSLVRAVDRRVIQERGATAGNRRSVNSWT